MKRIFYIFAVNSLPSTKHY